MRSSRLGLGATEMELYLIRHAQSQNNANPESRRVPDPSLTDRGRDQARYLADWLPSLNLTRLVTSPFLRTLETTEWLRQATGLEPEVRVELHEQGGCYAGHTPESRRGQPGMCRREIEQRFPRFRVDPSIDGEGWWRSQPYETLEQARLRAGQLLLRAFQEFGDTEERVAFVMHADIKVLLLEHVQRDLADTPRNTCVSTLLVTQSQARLQDYNRVEHLPGHLVTG